MSNIDNDISVFLTTIDSLSERLHPPQRSQDAGAPECTTRQLSALQALNRNGRLRMSELAALIDVPLSTATRLVDQLVAKNLLERKASPADARIVEVGFSKLGNDINLYIDQSRQKQALDMLKILPEKERTVLLSQLTRLINT